MNALHFNKKLRAARDYMQLENYAEALSLYGTLAKQFPQGGLWGEYGRAAAMSGDFELAERIWGKIRSVEPNSADLLSRLAWEYQNIRLHAKARELYQQAANLEPRNLDRQLGLAWLLARTNSVDEARIAVNKCLEIDPRDEQARYLSAHLDRRENKLAGAEQQFRDLLASAPRHPYVGYACHSELANILDRTERFEEAMALLAQGKKGRQTAGEEAERKRTEIWYEDTLRQIRALPKNILDAWGKSFPPRARTAATPLAFLTGAARSGTTLLERILDAHPAVAACDEALAFKKIQPLIDFTAPAIPAQRLNVLREQYAEEFDQGRGRAGPPGKILLDKNPSQTVWLPAFLRAFPELRVLIALRDPRDVMISLYFQNQTSTNHLTFENLAQYYRNVMDVWLAVREWEGLVWLETRYEDIVADLRKEGGRVTQFLGLEWHENQARFYESNREKPVMSTNYTDVTRPVYTRSIGRWRVYEKHLAPILPALEPYCRMFGYT